MTRLEEKLELKIEEEIIERKQCYGRLFCESDFRDGFWAAVSHIKKMVWHNKDEKPLAGRYVVITDGTGFMFDDKVERMNPRHKWAYLSDLLPEIEPMFPDEDFGVTKVNLKG